MANQIGVIKPYRWEGMWVFDDERVGLDKEPFVAGADTMIDMAVAKKGIKEIRNGTGAIVVKVRHSGHFSFLGLSVPQPLDCGFSRSAIDRCQSLSPNEFFDNLQKTFVTDRHPAVR